MSNTAANHFDIAVIGLGPVGSLGALLFAEAGLRVVAIEKDTEVYRLPRAVNLDGEIIRALQPLNLAETVNAMMQPLRADERAGFTDSQRNWLFGGRSVAMGSNGWQPANMFDQPELEGFLRATVQAHPNVTCYLGYELCDFISTDATVTMRAASADENLNVAARFMLACDGASSPTRKALNIKWRDLGYDQDWLVVDVEMLKSHELPNAVLQICDPDRIHTYVATKDPNRRWEFQLNPGETRAQMLEPQTIHALLDSWAPRDSYRLRRSAVYQFHAAVA
ncbi:MAG: FAD-dependent monooxygenase, partial [Pseudomonadota bacterium]|nr:FAD-dependent monooxygenase [Pseudomonadota bacterium]